MKQGTRVILVIDNYDSFTFNLVHLMRSGGFEVVVCRNDAVTVKEALDLQPEGIVISPGPGHPRESGISRELVRQAAGRVPVLGVCLGLQVIAEIFGGRIVHAPSLVHGKTSQIRHGNRGLFEGLPDPLEAMRYHSLIVDRSALPADLEITAWVDGEPETVMGLRHRHVAVEGIQFHPESFMTPNGAALVKAFLTRKAGRRA